MKMLVSSSHPFRAAFISDGWVRVAKHSALVLFLLLASANFAPAALLDIGPETSSFTGDTRGYWFTAPVDFIIDGLRVVTDQSTLPQNVEIVRLNSIPPDFNSTTNDFTSLFYQTNTPGNNFISTSIAFSAGDIVGILGDRGTGINSYGSNPYLSSIGGFAVTLARLGFQNDLINGQASNLFTETANGIGRVELQYHLVPEPSTLLLGAFASVGLILRRRIA